VDQFWFEGFIDELAVYNNALSPAQVSENFNTGISGQGACTFNFAPLIISSPDSTVLEDEEYFYEVVVLDGNENDLINISVLDAPEWLDGFAFTPGDSTAMISGIPGNDDVGINMVTVRVFDGKVNVDQEFQIRVINVNDPPEFTSSTATQVIDQNANFIYEPTATDPDGDELTFSMTMGPSWLTFSQETGLLTGIPANEDVGIHDVTMEVTDGTEQVTIDFKVTVNNVNDPPSITTTPLDRVNVGDTYLYQVEVDDPDQDATLTFVADLMPSWLTLTPASNIAILSGTPTMDDKGTHPVILKVSDGEAEDLQSFTITVIDATSVEGMDQLVSRMYPNPATEKVTFEFARSGKVTLKLYDLDGRLLKERTGSGEMITLDVSDLAKGPYFYTVLIDQETSIGKLIKE
jgi:hypothetical protein